MNKPESIKPEKMELTSMDVAKEKREELKRCFGNAFPEVFAEGNVDFDQLKRVLGEWVDPGKERFGLNWPGKAECMRIIQQPSVATLKPVRGESVNFDETQNLFIEGDNLEVLKLLQKAYFGKIKMIYIDPPYNTGNEFIYPDKYDETLETYLAYTGQIDSAGRKFSTATEQTGRHHSRWLRMLFPRLYLARSLLREDGVIFISIDNNEVAHLRDMCDEIFGSENFVEQIAWKNKYGAGAKTKGFIEVHEYILCYSKNSLKDVSSKLTEEQKAEYDGKDEKFATRGGYVTQPLMTNSLGDRENLQYLIEHDGELIKPRKQWVWEKSRLLSAIEKNEVVIKKKADGEYSVRSKVYLFDESGKLRRGKPLSLLNGPFNQAGTEEVENLIGAGIFDFPKPVALIKYLFGFSINEEDDSCDDIFLDFFAGSCTSAQAVFELNQEDVGRRKFIAVQLPEVCEANSKAHKIGCKTIADVGKLRLREYAKRATEAKSDQLSFKSPTNADLGFRVFKLDRSNFKVWSGEAVAEAELAGQIEMHIDHLSPKSSAEDILYELLLKAGFALSARVQTVEITGKQVFSIQDGALLICLDKEITPELIDALADANPLQVICLDEGFKGNDQLKTNAVQTFKARAQAEESEIVFKTV
jgi:adenine-specific DNA-methyltransferase